MRSGRDAIGARVTLELEDGTRRVRSIVGGGSFQSASARELVFGLCESDASATLTVDWPSGASRTLTAEPWTRSTLTEGVDAIERVVLPRPGSLR